MAEPLKILLVEDDEDDYLITSEYLDEIPGRSVDLNWVNGYDEGMAILESGGVDLCLVDYRIGGHTGLEFLEAAKERGLSIPMVLLTGVGQRDIDIAAGKAGAADFLDKSELSSTLLDRTIRYSIAHANALQALAEKTSFLETTLDNTGAGIAAFDARGNLATANHKFQDFVAQFGALEDANLTALAAHLSIEAEVYQEIFAPDGKTYELRSNPVPAGGSVLFILDVTEQRVLAENMITARNEAEAASRAKSSFLANISHELRTPLHSIIGYSELITQETPALNPIDCAEQINESGKHLLALIEAVLSYSKLESGDYSCKSTDIFELPALIDAAVSDIKMRAEQKSIDIQQTVDPLIKGLHADPMGIRQILINLLTNAIDFSDEGTIVEVHLEANTDGGVDLMVRDFGAGMDPEQITNAFTPFAQVDDTLARTHEGAGLGLPIVKSLVRHHEGEIRVETMPGEGTTVIIALPAERVRLGGVEDARQAG